MLFNGLMFQTPGLLSGNFKTVTVLLPLYHGKTHFELFILPESTVS